MSAPTASRLVVDRVGFGPDAVDYQDGWDLQRRVHADVVAARAPDTVLLLEHPPVYTAGRRTEPHERPFDGTPVVDVDRGGKITWHGPGQLVGYPIVRLPSPIDVVAHVRRLEAMLIDVLRRARRRRRRGSRAAAASGCRPTRRGPTARSPRSASGSRDGVTMHGFALNCDCDLAWFDRIVPCGIRDAGVTSLSRELGRDVARADVVPLVEARLPMPRPVLEHDPLATCVPPTRPTTRRPQAAAHRGPQRRGAHRAQARVDPHRA